jgi:hypothetical protein
MDIKIGILAKINIDLDSLWNNDDENEE